MMARITDHYDPVSRISMARITDHYALSSRISMARITDHYDPLARIVPSYKCRNGNSLVHRVARKLYVEEIGTQEGGTPKGQVKLVLY